MNRTGISRTALQLLAMTTMLADHIGMVFFTGSFQTLLRSIGRLAFPLYAFLLADGLVWAESRPDSVRKHLRFLFLLCLISEFPFDLMNFGLNVSLYTGYQNVVWTLLLGYFPLFALESGLYGTAGSVLAVAGSLILTVVLRCDYGVAGVILIYMFYFFRKQHSSSRFLPRLIRCLLILLLFDCLLLPGFESFDAFSPFLFFSVLLASIPIALYNGTPGTASDAFRLLYSWFYPLHMLFLGALSLVLPF